MVAETLIYATLIMDFNLQYTYNIAKTYNVKNFKNAFK